MDLRDLKKNSVQKLRMLHNGLASQKPNNSTSQDKLIHKIQPVYHTLVQFADEADEKTK